MKQSIVTLIRPKLNLGQKESQAAHLIEHILVAPKRLMALGISADFYSRNIVFHSGTVNDFYLAEYYIVRSEVAEEMTKILLKNQNELFLDRDNFKKIKSALIEEILENKGEFIDIGEQLAKTIYDPSSPSIRNAWNDLESVSNLSYDETIEIFKKYNTDIASFRLSFDDYKIDKLPAIEKNHLRENNGFIELWHPWQSPGSVDTYTIVRLLKNVDQLIILLYRRSLTDFRFGMLFDELRNKQGLVYDISVNKDCDADTLEIYFACSKGNSKKVSDHIKMSLEKYDDFILNNLKHIKERLKLELELDWGNIQNQELYFIDQVVSGGFTESPASLVRRMDSVTASDLSKFNRLFLNLLYNETVSVKRQHGKDVKENIGKESSSTNCKDKTAAKTEDPTSPKLRGTSKTVTPIPTKDSPSATPTPKTPGDSKAKN